MNDKSLKCSERTFESTIPWQLSKLYLLNEEHVIWLEVPEQLQNVVGLFYQHVSFKLSENPALQLRLAGFNGLEPLL